VPFNPRQAAKGKQTNKSCVQQLISSKKTIVQFGHKPSTKCQFHLDAQADYKSQLMLVFSLIRH